MFSTLLWFSTAFTSQPFSTYTHMSSNDFLNSGCLITNLSKSFTISSAYLVHTVLTSWESVISNIVKVTVILYNTGVVPCCCCSSVTKFGERLRDMTCVRCVIYIRAFLSGFPFSPQPLSPPILPYSHTPILSRSATQPSYTPILPY